MVGPALICRTLGEGRVYACRYGLSILCPPAKAANGKLRMVNSDECMVYTYGMRMIPAALLRSSLLAVLVLAAEATSANPTGPTVANGQVTINQAGNLLQITNSPNSIINWNTFSVAANEITRFVQQSSSSAILNRVVTPNPSAILGALQSNGRVFLVNPAGILFGAGSQVDVAGLVASTLNLSDQDFLAGRLRFTETPNAGAVVNQGAITGAGGGGIYLIGPSVTNGGLISNPQGEVVLAAGRSVELVDPGTPNLRVEINAPDNEALNLGQIIANSGRIGIYAGLIRTTGTLNADRAVAGPGGEIRLVATQSVIVEGTITALDGSITADAGTGTFVTGGAIVQASPVIALVGGDIHVDASVTLSGGNGQGTISISTGAYVALNGGNIHGANIQNGGNGQGTITVSSASNQGTISLTTQLACATSVSPPCGGSSSAPSIALVSNSGPASVVIASNSGSATVTLNGVTNPLSVFSSAGQLPLMISTGRLALSLGGPVISLGIGQIVGTLSTTSQINDFTRGLGGFVPELLTPPRTSLVYE